MKTFKEFILERTNINKNSYVSDLKRDTGEYFDDFLKNGYHVYKVGTGTSALKKLQKYYERKVYMRHNMLYCVIFKPKRQTKDKLSAFTTQYLENFNDRDISYKNLYIHSETKSYPVNNKKSSYYKLNYNSIYAPDDNRISTEILYSWKIEDVYLLINHELPDEYKASMKNKKEREELFKNVNSVDELLDILDKLENE